MHRRPLPQNGGANTRIPQPRMNGRDATQRAKILMLGVRRSGKTSIQQVLFNNLPPKQSFYLDATMRVTKVTVDTVIPIEIWDCPGNITVDTLGAPLSEFASMIFVIDIRDLYQQPVTKLVEFIVSASQVNPDINMEVFVHKAENLQSDDKIENFRQIHERVTDRLADEAPDYEQVPLNFYLTSVYDHTLHEAFSRVIHKLIHPLPYLEGLLNVFCANTSSPKAFLFDTNSRLYIATDASPVDQATYNLCCDFLMMLNAFGPLYKSDTAGDMRPPGSLLPPTVPAPPPTANPSSSASVASPADSSPPTPLSPSTMFSTKHQPSHSPVSASTSAPVISPTSSMSSVSALAPTLTPSNPPFYPSAATSLSPTHPGTTLTYHRVTAQLALLALLPSAVYAMRRGLVEYNVVWFREGVREVCDVAREVQGLEA